MVPRPGAALAAVSFALLAGPAFGQGWYGPVLVSDPPETSQDLGEGLAVDPAGNYTVVWDEDLDYAYGNVWLRRMRFDGIPLAASIRINSTDSMHAFPEIGSDETGNVVVAWGESPARNQQNWMLHVQRYDASGTPRGPDSVVKQGVDSSPILSVNAGGKYLLSWYQGSERRARVFAADGTPVAPEFVVNSALSNARLALTAQDKIVAGRTDGDGFALQCYSTSGSEASAVTSFGYEGGSHYSGNGGGNFTVAPDGSVILTWPEIEVDNAQGVAYQIINLSRIAPDCVTEQWHTDALRIVNRENLYGPRASVSRDGDQIGVSWRSSDGNTYRAFLRTFDAQGATLDSPYEVTGGQTLLTTPQVAIDANGEFTAVWGQGGGTSTYFDVYAAGTHGTDDGKRDLSIEMSASASTVNFGEAVSFTLQVRNRTAYAADGVHVQATLPEGFSIDGASAAGWACAVDGTAASCSLGAPLNGAASPITLAAHATTAGGSYSASATVSGNEPDGDLGNNTATTAITVVPPSADLEMFLFPSNYQITMGQTVTLSGEVTNWDSNIDATGVFVEFTYEPAFHFESASDPGWSCDATATGALCRYDSPLPENRAVGVSITVRAAAVPGTYAVAARTGSDQADPRLTNNRHPLSVDIVSPPYDLKVTLAANPSAVTPGGETVVTATVVNQTAGTYASRFTAGVIPPKDFKIKAISAPGFHCSDVYCTYDGTLQYQQTATVRMTLVAPYVIGKYPMSAAVNPQYDSDELAPADNHVSGQVEVAVCGVSDTSSQPNPKLKVIANPGGVHVWVCDTMVHVR